jgi:predicted ATPase
MLTRLEVDGFKNLVGFDAYFGPFTCIAGENGVGKSNIFDAIEFLARSADGSLMEAAQEIRSSRQDAAGEPRHLFTAGQQNNMRFAVEVVVPGEVTDDFGTTVTASITFLRYELELRYEPAQGASRSGRLAVVEERLSHINRGEANRHLLFPHSKKSFRDAVVVGRRSGGAFISTEADRITIHQDGGSRGRPKRGLPAGASTTVVSTINTADDPTVLAVRRELQSWRRLALEPTALRSPDRFTDRQLMESNGRHLAGALFRVAHLGTAGKPDDVYARIANRLSGLAGVDVRRLWVDVDETRELFGIQIVDGQGRELPARSLSEGTLRYLALCMLLEDPAATGLITMEEPENGIHPANLNEIVAIVRDLAVDPHQAPDVGNPLRQVIVNTHSPAVVQLVGADDLLLAAERPMRHEHRIVRALSLRAMPKTWRSLVLSPPVTSGDLLPYLTVPIGAQLGLFNEVA